MVGDQDRKEVGSCSEGPENPEKLIWRTMRGHRRFWRVGRETGVKKAVFRLTALHSFRFETFLGRPPRTQV